MHRVLRRQLRRALQLESNEAVDRFIAGTELPSGQDPAWRDSLLRLIHSIDDSYNQYDRDLALRTRSLDLSSAELLELSEKLRQEAEEQKSERSSSDQRLQLALEASDLGMWSWDFGAQSMFFDSRFGRFIGEDATDGMRTMAWLLSRTAPEEAQRLSDVVRGVVLGQSTHFAVELRVRHRQGHWTWLETFGSVTQRAGNGHAMRLSGTVADVSARKALEQSLAENLRLLETVLEAIPLPVLIRDRNLRVRRTNAALEHMLGIARDELIGRPLSALETSDTQIMTTGTPVHYESRVQGRQGAIFDTIVSKAPVRLADGTVDGIVSIVSDITAHKRAAAALDEERRVAQAATQAKSRFLANMSHELRTPLNGVVGMASLLETTSLEPRQQRYVHTLRRSAEALITIINDILDISKIEAGKLELSSGEVNLQDEIDQVISLFGARAIAKGVELAAHRAPGTPCRIRGDSVRIRQILSNLVSNAIKFTEDGEVLVTVSAPTDAEGRQWMRFEISDTGIGIAPQMQSMVFDAFAQVDDSSTRRFGGTGLGLTICRELVGLMGGSIGLNSEPGVGSCFHFQIPVESLGDSAMPEPQPAPAGHESLIVSPNRLIRAALVQSLQPSGSPPCLTANSLAEATQALERLPAKIRSVDIYLDACPRLAVTPDALAELRLAAQGRELRCTLLAPPAGNSNNELAVDQVIFKPICTVALAMRDRQSAAAAPAPVHAANLSAASGRKVLLVEDNAINQEIAVAMLDKLGIACLVAENGAEALELLAATPDIGLILMDCQMPIMDGFATTRAIRQGKVASQVPVIALTGNAMQGDKEACLAAGMNDYLTKPFGLAALQDKLQRWLKPEEAGLLARHPLAHQVT